MRPHREFWRNHFRVDMKRANNLSNDRDTTVLRDGDHAVFYRENADSIHLNLSSMSGRQPAIAVDTLRPYQEIDLGKLDPTGQTWTAPYRSDWAIATGSFSNDSPDPEEPAAPSGLEGSAIAPKRIDLSWNAPNNGGSPIIGYRIERKTENETDFSTSKKTPETTAQLTSISQSSRIRPTFTVSPQSTKSAKVRFRIRFL